MKQVKCDVSTFTPISPTTVRISGGTKNIRPYYYGKNIVSLEMPDNSVMIEKLNEHKDLTKKKKAELLEIANKLSLEVNSRNTKAEIIAAIEKQSR